MTLPYFLSFVVSPVVIVLLVAYLRFKFSIKNMKNIQMAVILGIVAVALLMITNYLAELRWHGNYNNMRRMAFFVFIVTAFSSELAKFLILKARFYSLKTFTGPLEGIIYSVFINLGFALVAVILYAFDLLGLPDKIHNSLLFLYAYPFASIIFGICMGFFVGMGKMRRNGFIDNSTGLFVSTFFHGLFYFGFITSDIRLLIFTAIGFIVIGVTLLVKSVSKQLERK